MCRLLGAEPAKRLHRTPDHPRKRAPPLQSRSLGVRTPPQQQDGPVSVRQSSNSIQVLVVATRVEVRTGVRKVKFRESECEIKFLTQTELGENLSFAILMYMALRDGCQRPGSRGRTSTALSRALADGALDARGRVYEGGPQPLWAAR